MRKINWLLLAIILLATVVRLYNLTAISMWHDEAFSALLIKYSWSEMFYRIGLDVHPPIYYVFLRIWSDVFGDSLFALRGFSAFFGIATVYATYLFVKKAFDKEGLALAAAALIAVNPFQIQYVTEARMYTLGSFLVIISCYFLINALQAQKQYFENDRSKEVINKLWLNWLLLAAATSLAWYTHYYLFFSTFAVGLYALYWHARNYGFSLTKYRYMAASYMLVFISYIPWLKTFKYQFSQVQENYWIPKMIEWSIPLTNWRMLFGVGADINKASTRYLLVAGTIFSLLVIYRVIKKEIEQSKWLVILGLIVPFLGALLLSLKQSIYLDRYFLFAALFYTIALAIFIYQMRIAWFKYSLLGIMLIIILINWNHEWKNLDMKNKPGMAEAAKYLNNNVAGSDKLYIGSSFEYFNFKYYNKTGKNPLLYTPGITDINQLPHFSGTALLTNADLIHDFNGEVKKGDTVWVLWTNAFGGSQPNTPQNWVKLDEKAWADVRPYPGTWIIVMEYKVQ